MQKIHPSIWHNKIAVITGASSGIGAATARNLARHGLKVILVARRQERLEQLAGEIRLSGGQAEIISADLSQESERERVFAQVEAEYGQVDVLVNNAAVHGVSTRISPIVNVTEEDWDKTLQINLKSVFLFCKGVVPIMIKNRTKDIL